MTPTIRILYFAWLREHIGADSQSFPAPPPNSTFNDLILLLAAQSPAHALAFQDLSKIRVAVNHQHVSLSDVIPNDAHDVAFFPPITGG